MVQYLLNSPYILFLTTLCSWFIFFCSLAVSLTLEKQKEPKSYKIEISFFFSKVATIALFFLSMIASIILLFKLIEVAFS